MGLVANFFSVTTKFFLFAAIVYFLYRTFSNANKKDEVLIAAAYITGFEVFSRMTGGVGFSYEFAKYAVIGFMLLGMFFKGFTRKSLPYFFFIVLLIPGILFSAINLDYESSFGNAIGFNLSGPVCLAITALYCYDRKIPAQRFQEILIAVLLPIICTTIYLYLFTPSIRDTLTGTQSNSEASGGFGPNQVSTILGLGAFILFSRLLTNKNRFINFVDLILLILVSYRAIVTFSRGGVIVAVICSLVFLAVYFLRTDVIGKANLIPKIAIISLAVIVTWIYSSVVTLGLINKRYSNQDAAGREKSDITTGRADLINEELLAFYEHPLTGVGVGKTKEFRQAITGYETATHNEVSRMLSEHGLFGLLALIVLIVTPFIFGMKNKTNLYLYSFFIFWILTINHSSMRIAAPAFIYGLALITLVNAKKNPVPRK